MAPIPYASAGIASFETGDSQTQTELFNSAIPLPVTEDFPVASAVALPQFSVVGLGADGNLALAVPNASPAIAATGALTFSGTGTADDTITVGSRTYTLKAAAAAADEVVIGATAAETAANLIAAINGAGGAGYHADTVPHADVYARANTTTIVGIVARVPGTAGNSIATTESGTGTSFGAATLTGGLAAAGVAPIGITTAPVLGTSGAKRVAIYRAGNFNPAALNWHSSFSTDALKAAAFRGAPAPTNIVIRKRL